jgi:hypothetical protein
MNFLPGQMFLSRHLACLIAKESPHSNSCYSHSVKAADLLKVLSLMENSQTNCLHTSLTHWSSNSTGQFGMVYIQSNHSSTNQWTLLGRSAFLTQWVMSMITSCRKGSVRSNSSVDPTLSAVAHSCYYTPWI